MVDAMQGGATPRSDRAAFGRFLKQARQARGLSQGVLAKSAGVSAVFVSQIENGQRIPSDGVARKLAEALGLAWQPFLQDIYRLRSYEAGELFSQSDKAHEPGWRSATEIPSIRMLLLQLAGLDLPARDLDMLLQGWSHQVDILKTQLRKAQNE